MAFLFNAAVVVHAVLVAAAARCMQVTAQAAQRTVEDQAVRTTGTSTSTGPGAGTGNLLTGTGTSTGTCTATGTGTNWYQHWY